MEFATSITGLLPLSPRSEPMPLVLLDGHELAARLGVRHARVMSWARLGKIPCVKTGKGRVLFNLDLVVDALRPDLATSRPKLAAVGSSK
jgi:hypothetical protein